MTLAEVHVKWSVIFMDLLDFDIFRSTLWMKGQVLHCEQAHLKVPGWSLVWNELLTKKLPVFLSRLNKISGGYEKIVLVSESFGSNLKFLRMTNLIENSRRISYLFHSFWDFVMYVVTTVVFPKSVAMCQFFDKRGYPFSVDQAGHHRAQSTVSTTNGSKGKYQSRSTHSRISPSQPRS